MKIFVLCVALVILSVDLINAKSLKTKIFRERRAYPPPRHGGLPVQRFELGYGGQRSQYRDPMQNTAGQMQGPVGQMQRPMGPMQGPVGQLQGPPGAMGQQQMGGPGCGGCSQGPKMCPAICMRWNTIIKPNGQIENGPSSITPLAPNERVGPDGVFPPMNQMMGPMMQQPGMMQQPQPYGMQAGLPSPGAPPATQPPQGPPPTASAATAAPTAARK